MVVSVMSKASGLMTMHQAFIGCPTVMWNTEVLLFPRVINK